MLFSLANWGPFVAKSTFLFYLRVDVKVYIVSFSMQSSSSSRAWLSFLFNSQCASHFSYVCIIPSRSNSNSFFLDSMRAISVSYSESATFSTAFSSSSFKRGCFPCLFTSSKPAVFAVCSSNIATNWLQCPSSAFSKLFMVSSLHSCPSPGLLGIQHEA